MPKFPLAVNIRARVHLKKSAVESQNVAGLLPGTDPKLKNEYVFLTAHLDHVGVGPAINGDSIYNGAMDDASGIASILEIARLMHESNAKLRRSAGFSRSDRRREGIARVALLRRASNRERKEHCRRHQPGYVPAAACLALSSKCRGWRNRLWATTSAPWPRKPACEVQADKEPQRNLFIRSDQYSFIKKGIPALAFKFGYLPGSPEEKLHKEWLKNRYHAPSDDLNQPVDKAAAAEFNQILLTLAERVANASERPQWKPDSFFRRFASGS